MNLNLNTLRALNGSQQKAFEFLCCILAQAESIPNGNFTKKGAPDAGVECFWKLPNGDEYCWQAKFFLASPSKVQIQQINDSIKTAIEKHPRMTKYYICLPIDRSDSRLPNQKSFLKKWEELTIRIEEQCKLANRDLEIIYWGEFEIIDRLLRHRYHHGLTKFLFDKDWFAEEWFDNNLNEVIYSVGPRFSAELNLKMPISTEFDAFTCNDRFKMRICELFDSIEIVLSKLPVSENDEKLKTQICEIQNLTKAVMEQKTYLLKNGTPLNNNFELIEKLQNIQHYLDTEFDLQRQQRRKAQDFSMDHNSVSNQLRVFETLGECIAKLAEFLNSKIFRVFHARTVLITGEAGTGKTHLLCDLAKTHITNKHPAVMLLGNRFVNSDPFGQIIQQLDLAGSNFDLLLQTLDLRAQLSDSVALIIIDALNEGDGRNIWPKYINQLIAKIQQFPSIRLILSIRSTYRDFLSELDANSAFFYEIVHRGFDGSDFDAATEFFNYYKIQIPTIPIFGRVFTNPLFLKTFCQAMKNDGLRQIPTGIHGITTVFNLFLTSVEKKLAHLLDYDISDKLTFKSITALCDWMITHKKDFIPNHDAKQIINEIYPSTSFSNSLFKHLIDEGVLRQETFAYVDGKRAEIIVIAYQRFSDIYRAQSFMKKVFTATGELTHEQELLTLISDNSNYGLVEALSIIIPEKFNKELFEYIPVNCSSEIIKMAFLDSIIWRNPSAFITSSEEYIKKNLHSDLNSNYQYIERLLIIAHIMHHPYNANALHQYLINQTMTERDLVWSTYLSEYGDDGGVASQIINWAWTQKDVNSYNYESIYLIAKTLCWFFTSSHRFIRDQATKALVNLLDNRLSIFLRLFNDFRIVNDIYVIERLMCACYGCVLRATDTNNLEQIANSVYKWIFQNKEPIPHLLVRDYASGIIDYALRMNAKLDTDLICFRPPYHSKWPKRVLTKEQLAKKYFKKDSHPGYLGQKYLIDSVLGGGDFARYIIGTNSGYSNWSSIKLNDSKKSNSRIRYKKFLNSLNDDFKKIWEEFESSLTSKFIGSFSFNEKCELEFLTQRRSGILSDDSKKILDGLLQQLDSRSKDECVNNILPYILNTSFEEKEPTFDLKLAQRYILQRVFEFGWGTDLFGEFDGTVPSGYAVNRKGKKPERIGKKYQWIAFHEFLSLLADNFNFRPNSYDELENYKGPWQIYARDIDPSMLLTSTSNHSNLSMHTCWWVPFTQFQWPVQNDELEWLKKCSDLPDFKTQLEVVNPRTNSTWIVLNSFYILNPDKTNAITSGHTEMELFTIIHSYIVKKVNLQKIYNWLNKVNLYEEDLPESGSDTQVFLGEYFKSNAFIEQFAVTTDTGYINNTGDLQTLLEPSAMDYSSERSGYDCSIKENFHITLPSPLIVKSLDLIWNGKEGCFFNRYNELVAFDPSVEEAGPRALLIKKEALINFLETSGYSIIWTIMGEKQILKNLREENYGQSSFYGVYKYEDSRFIGEIKTKYREANSPY